MTKKKIENQDPSQEGSITRRYRVQFDISYRGSKGLEVDSTSITEPDASITIRQMLENFVNHGSTGVNQREPLYFETEIPTIRDITDVQAYKESLQQRVNDVNVWLETQRNEKQKKEAAAAAANAKKDPPPQKDEDQKDRRDTD